MYNRYNLASQSNDEVIDSFLSYLKSNRLSKNSIRFYKSDLSHFTAWTLFKIKSLGILAESFKEVIPFLRTSIAREYRDYLLANQIPAKTINRRFSTLRKFSEFLVNSNIISFDIASGLENIVVQRSNKNNIFSLVEDFQKHLESQKASKNTIKNYVADVKHFLTWTENKNYAA